MVIGEKRSIVIVGAGQLGSRYLQGLAAVSHHLRVQVVDPSIDALERAAIRWSEVDGPEVGHEVSYHGDLCEVASDVGVVVVATTAPVRPAAVEAVAERTNVATWVLEKVLAQSLDDLQRIVHAVGGDMAWVNTWGRMTPWYQRLRGAEAVGPVRFWVEGGSWGMACNAIHVLDLIAWWTGEDLVGVDAGGLDADWLPGKRPGMLEVSGSLVATYSGGTTGVLYACRSAVDGEPAGTDGPEVLGIDGPGSGWLIERPFSEIDGVAVATDGTRVRGRIEFQSERTAPLVDDLLNGRGCGLTDLATSAEQHRIFLSGLLYRWSGVAGRDLDRLPIT